MIQGSDLNSSQKMWRICGKSKVHFVLAFIVAIAGVLMVAGKDTERIASGVIPPAGKYPSIGRMVQYFTDINYTLCAVSILNRDWIVCAASCVTTDLGPRPVDDLTVIVGDEILNETEPYERVHKVERVIVHHRHQNVRAWYNKQTGDDIAVVKVTPPIMFSNRVSPTNLPTCKEPETGIGLVAGYGYNSRRKKNYRLMEITNKIISKEECSQRLNYKVDDRVFCVEVINNMSTCFADNGAPLFLVKSDAYMVQVGLMNTWPDNDRDCGIGDAVIATFLKLSSYVGWIHRRISGCGNHEWWNITEALVPDNGK